MNLSDQKLMFVKLVPELENVREKNTKQNNRNKNKNQLTIMPGTMTRSIRHFHVAQGMHNTSLFYPLLPRPHKKQCIRIVFAIIRHLHIDHNAPCLYPAPLQKKLIN